MHLRFENASIRLRAPYEEAVALANGQTLVERFPLPHAHICLEVSCHDGEHVSFFGEGFSIGVKLPLAKLQLALHAHTEEKGRKKDAPIQHTTPHFTLSFEVDLFSKRTERGKNDLDNH